MRFTNFRRNTFFLPGHKLTTLVVRYMSQNTPIRIIMMLKYIILQIQQPHILCCCSKVEKKVCLSSVWHPISIFSTLIFHFVLSDMMFPGKKQWCGKCMTSFCGVSYVIIVSQEHNVVTQEWLFSLLLRTVTLTFCPWPFYPQHICFDVWGYEALCRWAKSLEASKLCILLFSFDWHTMYHYRAYSLVKNEVI